MRNSFTTVSSCSLSLLLRFLYDGCKLQIKSIYDQTQQLKLRKSLRFDFVFTVISIGYLWRQLGLFVCCACKWIYLCANLWDSTWHHARRPCVGYLLFPTDDDCCWRVFVKWQPSSFGHHHHIVVKAAIIRSILFHFYWCRKQLRKLARRLLSFSFNSSINLWN